MTCSLVPMSLVHLYNTPWIDVSSSLSYLCLARKETSLDHHARAITTPSSSAAMLSTINWDFFRDGPARKEMSSFILYHQSKFQANVVVARQVAKRYAERGVISLSVDPVSHVNPWCV
ncbi:hypothetical protein AcV7_004876 [Taiwanofungus camphoratus]|nr:hypothetical protein AcV7_004876 [Antrodia cinnamomea]